jgi:hypothetical protein
MRVLKAVAAGLAVRRNTARRSLAVAAVAALLLGAAAAPAHAASWQMFDDFEGSPWNEWTITGGGHFSHNAQWAYSGSEYAYLVVHPGGNGSKVNRTFNLPSANWRSCRVAINVRAVNNNAYVILTAQKAGAATGAQQALTLQPGQGWVAMQVFPVPAGWGQLTSVTVYLSPVLGTADIRVDDLRVWCWT